jgi:diguanylate cyclase (GGDEF)-like protein/PAS domain S-box-containing protein
MSVLQNRMPAYAVLVVSLAVAAFVWDATRRSTAEHIQLEFQELVEEIAGDIDARMTAFEDALHASRGYLLASRGIERENWLTFQQAQRLEHSHPGTLGMGYTPVVPASQLRAHVAAVRAEEKFGYTVRPPGNRPAYAPIRFTASHNRDTAALGFDMYSEPVRRDAMLTSRDTGRAALSAVTPILRGANQGRNSVFLFLAVYDRPLGDDATVETRREAVRGYVHSPLLVDSFMRDIAQKIEKKLLFVRITETDGRVLFSAPAGVTATDLSFQITQRKEVHARPWVLEFAALPGFAASIGGARDRYVGVGGLVISLLLFAIVWSLTSTRLRAERLARAMTRDLRESEARFRDLTDLSSDWYWEQDEELRYTIMSGTVLQRTGRDVTQVLGKRRWELPGMDVPEDEWARHKAMLEAREPFADFVLRRLRPDGEARYVSLSGRPIFDEHGTFRGYRGTGKDITSERVADERIQYLAYHDGLTGLPNRSMFSRLLNHGIAHAHRNSKQLAVLFIDLDRFKNINDTLGHEAGDALLIEVGSRIKQMIRGSDTVARLGGDEFVILIEDVKNTDDVAVVAGKILSAIVKPFNLAGQDFRVTASIGISIYPQDGDSEQVLMKKADIAMYQAKEEGKNNFQFHSPDMDKHSFERLTLESNLRNALERNEFELYYQAKKDLRSGRVTGMEALIRWMHPEMGMISPIQFIPLAEETGLIVPIGKWVLETACRQNCSWQQSGTASLCIAVNLSPRQFADENLVTDVAAILERTGMAPDLLELEITESMIMHNVEKAVVILSRLKGMGIRLAIDDFGTGYSSLSNLKRFPIDTIKVDRSFIRDLPQDPEDMAITKAIIAMGQSLSLTVTAEGVETQAQIDFLRAHACDEFQGFYFSKPVPADAFRELLLQEMPRAGA